MRIALAGLAASLILSACATAQVVAPAVKVVKVQAPPRVVERVVYVPVDRPVTCPAPEDGKAGVADCRKQLVEKERQLALKEQELADERAKADDFNNRLGQKQNELDKAKKDRDEAVAHLTDVEIKNIIISRSIEQIAQGGQGEHPCPCPIGSTAMKKAIENCPAANTAYCKGGGDRPVCFEGDIDETMIKRYRNAEPEIKNLNLAKPKMWTTYCK
jgi:hypothetical protein